MIVVTSLSPNHTAEENKMLIDSWKVWGKCYSLNHPKEHDQIQAEDISIVPVQRTMETHLKKPLININSILDFAPDTDLLMINSDIILRGLPIFRRDGITIMSRYDFTGSFENVKVFKNGFDVFYIPKQFLSVFPPSIYALGAAWHDYWLPKWCIILGIPLYYPQEQFAYHKIHETNYSYEEWLRLGEYFRWEFRLEGTIPQIAVRTLAEIRSKLILV